MSKVKRGKNNTMYNKHHTSESREKMSNIKLEFYQTEEGKKVRMKMSEIRRLWWINKKVINE